MKAAAMRRVYLRESAVMLVLALLAVRLVPPARLFAWADRPPRRIRRFAADEARWVSWAVEERGLNALSLPRALAAHAMLRRRGIASRLCLGVAREAGEVAARAWVEIGTDKIVGGAGTERFTRLAEFGQVRPSIAMKVP
ncbi:MAG: lasso peptide biosynthesis B2 protein [Candidatus Binataceae bacterium]